MKASKLYKYLDVKGGLAMLSNSNLQFTNATRLNDPFDCHPSLIDFSNVPEEQKAVWGQELIMNAESSQFEQRRNGTWLCSLSKVNNSLLMWSYYSNHKGVCIGLDMENTRKYLSNILCTVFIGAKEFVVQYKDIIEKPDFFKEKKDLWRYQLSTKAKEWEHEQEVRLFIYEPSPWNMKLLSPSNDKENHYYREQKTFVRLHPKCFESIYLGVNIKAKDKEDIIQKAKNLNPDIIIYQMDIDSQSFNVIEKLE